VDRLPSSGDVDAGELRARTGGNAFLVAECLAAGGTGVPDGARAAVLARAARLSGPAREALDAVAVVPGRVELWRAAALGASPEGMDEAVQRGVLVEQDGAVRLRHELARAAVEDALPPARRAALHARAVALLADPATGEVDHARVVHHAAAVGDVHAVARDAPAAAAAAEVAGARRQAVAHLEFALHAGTALQDRERQDLWARLGDQLALLGRSEQSVAAWREALALTDVDEPQRRAEMLLRSCAALVSAGRNAEVHAALDEALGLLDQDERTSVLASALVMRCSVHMLARELTAAVPWGDRPSPWPCVSATTPCERTPSSRAASRCGWPATTEGCSGCITASSWHAATAAGRWSAWA